MSVSRSILLAASRNKTLNDFALHSSFVKRATRRFMPGEHAEDALAAAANIAATGRGIIFTQLGEAITRAEPLRRFATTIYGCSIASRSSASPRTSA